MAIRVGKLGIIRRTGKDLEELRAECFERDRGVCQDCRVATLFGAPHEHPHSFHMAHYRGKRNNGDTLDNVRCLCAAIATGRNTHPEDLYRKRSERDAGLSQARIQQLDDYQAEEMLKWLASDRAACLIIEIEQAVESGQ